ncbi:adenylate kinase [Patescibacteria group bacterium]|nr:adenylate kinase [Patescibacteria group bacterium]
MNFILFGPQGSGKGTQAKVLSAKLNIPHISTGSIFREQIKKQTALGKKIKNIVRQGKLISDIITNKVLKKRLSAKDCRAGFILDGYPRNLTQAKFLDKLINTTLALEIWISDKEAVKRISQRRICVKCGAIYHLEFNPPATDNICDLCHSKLSVRKDDKKQAIQKRLRAYHSQTALLINYYKKRKVYKKINGMPSIKEVSKKIYKMIE